MAEIINHRFDVKWTNRDETYAFVMGQLYANEEQFDLIIKLDGGKQLLAHRHIMGILSHEIKDILEEELNPFGSFVTETSEVELMNIPCNIMKKILDYVYYGTVKVCKWEMKKFCNVLDRLGIITFLDKEIKSYIKKMKTKDETAEMVFRNRGHLIAQGFQQLLCDERWCDIKIEVDFMSFGAHRIALSIGSLYFKSMFDEISPTTIETTVDISPQGNLSFVKAFDSIAFIYSGMLHCEDLADYLNAGETLEILGLRGCDTHCAEKTDNDRAKRHKIFATAEGIPADHPLRKIDIHRKMTPENDQKLAKRKSRASSSSAASGSEYEVEKDSDEYSDSDDAMPLVTLAKHQTLQPAAKASKKVQPQNDFNGQKHNKPVASVSKQAKANGSRSKKSAIAKKRQPKAVPSESQGEETVTISKTEYDVLMRLLQRIGGGQQALRVSAEQQFNADPTENENDQYRYEDDDALDQPVDENQPEYCDESAQPEFDNGDQYAYEYDDDENMVDEGAVGGLVQKHDENDNELVDADEPNDWVAENDSVQNDLADDGEDGNIAAPLNIAGRYERAWADDDYIDEAEFEISQRGTNRLRHDGYYYNLNVNSRQLNDYTRWKCANHTKFKCKAKTKTKEFDGIVMVQRPNPEHNHERVFHI